MPGGSGNPSGNRCDGKDKIACQYCDKVGHKRPDCRKLKRDEENGTVDHKPKGRRNAVKKTEDSQDDDSENDTDFEDEEASGSGGLSVIYYPGF